MRLGRRRNLPNDDLREVVGEDGHIVGVVVDPQEQLPFAPIPHQAIRCRVGEHSWLDWGEWFQDPPVRVGQIEVRNLVGPEQYARLVVIGECKITGSDGNEFTLRRRDIPEPLVLDSRQHLLCVYLRPGQDVAWEDAWLGVIHWIQHDEIRFRETAFDQGPLQPIQERVPGGGGAGGGGLFIVRGEPYNPPEIQPLIFSSLVLPELTQARAPGIVNTLTREIGEQFQRQYQHVRYTLRTLQRRDFEFGPGNDPEKRGWRFTSDRDYVTIIHNELVPDRCIVGIHSVTVDPRDTVQFDEMIVVVGASRVAYIGLTQLYIPTDVIVGQDTQYRFQPTGFLESPIMVMQNGLINVELRRRLIPADHTQRDFTFILNGYLAEPNGRGLAG